MSANDIKYLVLHCSASRCNLDYSVEQLRRDHKARGFYDIGYHFYIRKDGTMTQHRMLLEVGAHARPYNRCSIGICYEGGLDEQGKPCNTMTTEQETRLIDLFRNLKILFRKRRLWGIGFAGDYSQRVSVFGCGQLGCSSSSRLILCYWRGTFPRQYHLLNI